MNNYCSIISLGASVDLQSDRDLFSFLNTAERLRDHPDFKMSPQRQLSGYSLLYKPAEKISVVYGPGKCFIQAPWSLMNGGETLLYASYPLLEHQRQISGWLTGYGAAVCLSGKGIMLFGKSGAGKTSVAIDLCRRYGAELMANDLAIIGQRQGAPFVKGGTKFLFLRLESIRRALPDLMRFFPEKRPDPWLYKVKIDPSSLGINCRDEMAPINKAFSLHVDENQSSLYVRQERSLAFKLFLIENFSRYIKGSCINVLSEEPFSQLGFIPSYDSQEIFLFRRDFLELILDRIVYISGPLRLVTDYIKENCS